MEELLGISNSGFSFTDTYLKDINSLIDYVNSNPNEVTTYIGIQNSICDPSRVRMIVPFLRNISVIDDSLFEENNGQFVLKKLFTRSSKAFIKACEVHKLIVDLEDQEPKKKWRKMFRLILMEKYLHELCVKKPEYIEFIKFLLKNDSIDKFEFFVLTTMQFNGVRRLFSCNSIDDVVAKYRTYGIDETLYTYKTNINCYSYIMAVLCDFNVCAKSEKKFVLVNKERLSKLLEDLL